MFPTLFEIGPFPIHSFKIGPFAIHLYGLMIAIGFLTALHLSRRDGAKAGMDPNVIGGMAFWGLLFGILGARVFHIILYPEGYSWTDPVGWIAIWQGGLVFQGALPGAFVYLVYACRKNKISFWKGGDLALPYVALAHAFGRVGCFLNGCCYGKRTDLPWGIPFPRIPWDLTQPATGSPAYLEHCQRFSELSTRINHWSYPVHPTQLYGVVGLLALCLILLFLRKHWHPFTGFVMPVYFALYGVGRFFVEYLRGDHNPMVFGALSVQQVISVITVIAGIVLFLILRQWSRGQTADRND